MPTAPVSPTKEVTVDGYTYTLSLLPAWDVLELTPVVGKLVAPALSSLAGLAGKNQTTVEDLDEKALHILGDALSKTVSALSAAELRQLATKLLTGALVDLPESGETVHLMKIFALHFQGRPLAMLQLVARAIAANFSDFTAGLQAVAKRLNASKPNSQASNAEPRDQSKTNASDDSGQRGG